MCLHIYIYVDILLWDHYVAHLAVPRLVTCSRRASAAGSGHQAAAVAVGAVAAVAPVLLPVSLDFRTGASPGPFWPNSPELRFGIFWALLAQSLPNLDPLR